MDKIEVFGVSCCSSLSELDCDDFPSRGLPSSSLARRPAPFIFSEEPMPSGEVPPHFLTPFLGKEMHRIYCAIDGSWNPGHGSSIVQGIFRTDGSVIPLHGFFFYQICYSPFFLFRFVLAFLFCSQVTVKYAMSSQAARWKRWRSKRGEARARNGNTGDRSGAAVSAPLPSIASRGGI